MHTLNIFCSRWFTGIVMVTALIVANQAKAQTEIETAPDTLTQTVLIHPVIADDHIVSSEHTYNSDLRLGDQIARDFSIAKINKHGILRRFKGQGLTNEDWYGWRKKVLAPISGRITRVNHPDTTNRPGVMNREAQPGLVFFQRADSTVVIYAHVREIEVEEGEQVKAGEVIGRVGNNGNSRAPHIHVGAWKEETPLQIQVDLYAEHRDGQPSEKRAE
ncbi:M23 family metallopeptidase [Fodinibius sediminis]|uniref:Peptidase family M23 n=1 Tax=Fodinibius sediminis TaxID=1214077 RepID=A0A521CM85_9BACT|nr:M23 family metallopeptidase [Fodinibius sediminis]SMO60546.1 Peptidase family M23 [Fodinibius sediminis]